MERQTSSYMKPTRIPFICLAIPLSLILSLWAFSISPSSLSATQFPLSTELKSPKPDAFAASSTNPRPKDSVLMKTHVLLTANLSGEAMDFISGGQYSIFNDSYSRRATILSKEGIDLVGEKKNVLSDSKVSPTAATFSASPSTEANISKIANFMSNGSFDSVHEKNTSSVLAEPDAKFCDISDGRWVYDESYPLYSSDECPYMDEGFSCEANGRTDRGYMKWRWQPKSCNIPRFSPVKFLELIRGKRLVFVGDSINRNQWESMMCLLRGAILDLDQVYEAHGRRITKEKGVYNFKFMGYGSSVEYYVSHFLVHESKARVGKKRIKTLRIDTMDRSSSRWRGADILVFNTAHWWSHYKTKAGLNYYQEGGKVYPHLDVFTAFRKALTTWASWVDRNVDVNKTHVFFRSLSPSHFSGGEWSSGGHCKESTRPLNYTIIPNTLENNLLVDQVIKHMRTPVTVLNITNLSGLRIDAHPSIYGRRPGIGPFSSVQDCSHWCLPGVPDTWNELLYFYLQSMQERFFAKKGSTSSVYI